MVNWIDRRILWLGRQGAVRVVGGTYAVALLAGLTLSARQSDVVFVICPLIVAVYCLSRPTQGWDVFAISAAPAAGSAMAAAVLGTPRWLVGWPLAVISLLVLASYDKERRTALDVR